MPTNPAINPFNYNIDSFDSGFLGPITDTNFRTYLFTHNLGVPNSVVSGVLSNPWAALGTEYDVSQSGFNVVDVPNLQTVANTPSVYNSLTNPRQVNIGSNLQSINPQVQANIGQSTPTQAGQGVDASTQINQNPSNIDVPGLQTVANTPSTYNNLTNPRQVNLAGNLSQIDPAIQANIGQTTPIQAGQGADATTLFNPNVVNVDVPSPTIVANTPSVYNSLTNPRQVNLASNLSQINPAVQSSLGLTTPTQAGQGTDATTLFNPNTSNLDLPSAESAAQNPTNINNFTTPRQDNLDMNPTSADLLNWYPLEFDVVYSQYANTYNTSYGVPQTVQIGFVGNIEAWVEPSGVVTPSVLYSQQNILNQANNKWGPENLVTPTWSNNGLQDVTIVNGTGFVGYKYDTSGLLDGLLGQLNDFQSQITGISLANPKNLGVGIIPFSDIGSGIDFKPDGQNKSELEKIAGKRRAAELANRVLSNAVDDTIGRFSFLQRPFAALAGNPLFERNYVITSRAGVTGSLIDQASSLIGLNAIGTNFFTGPNLPPGTFNGSNDVGSSFGQNLISKDSYDISESLLDHTGNATKSLIFEALNRNKYRPNTEKGQGAAGTDFLSKYKTKDQKNYLTYDQDNQLDQDVGEAAFLKAQGDETTRKQNKLLKNAKNEFLRNKAREEKSGTPTELQYPTANDTPVYGGFFGKDATWDNQTINYSDRAGFNDDVQSTSEYFSKVRESTTWNGSLSTRRLTTTSEFFDWRYRSNEFKKGLLKYTQNVINQSATNSDNPIPDPSAKLSPQAMIQEPAGMIGYFDSDLAFKKQSLGTETITTTTVIRPSQQIIGADLSPEDIANIYNVDPQSLELDPNGNYNIPEVTQTTTETKEIFETLNPENSAHLTGVESLGESPTLPSKGNMVRPATIKVDSDKNFIGVEGGDVYCRSWTSRRKYHRGRNLIRNDGNWWKIDEKYKDRMTMNWGSEGDMDGRPKIAWDSYDASKFNPSREQKKLEGMMIPYMFSIENLAWKDAPQRLELPACELGPNGGRIMWFPPYNIDFSDNVSINWDKTDFIGRGEAIYTYNNTERSGNLSWTIVVDHPEVLNNLRNTLSLNLNKANGISEADATIESFFAGCANIEGLFEPVKIPEITIPDEEPCIDCDPKPTPPKDPPYQYFQVFFENAIDESGNYTRPNGNGVCIDPNTKQPTTDIHKCIGRVIQWDYESKYAYIGKPNWGGSLKTPWPFSDCGASGTTRVGLNDSSTPIQTDQNGIKIGFGYERLKELAEFLVTEDGKNFTITLIGSTSASGNNNYNTRLADDRATSLKKQLFDLMIAAENGNPPKLTVAGTTTQLTYPTEQSLYNNPVRWHRNDGISLKPRDETKNKEETKCPTQCCARTTKTVKNQKGENVVVTDKQYGPGTGGKCVANFDSPAATSQATIGNKLKIGKCIYHGGSSYPYGFCFEGNPCGPVAAPADVIEDGQANSLVSKQNRMAMIKLEVNTTLQQELLKQIGNQNKTKAEEEYKKKKQEAEQQYQKALKKAVNGYITECDYFMEMKKDAPFVYNTIFEKIQNFHPAFHAITPEGFNSRLTFLQQCTRQGPQMIDENLPNNMVFGRPPICVLRIGDFYHTKIVIDSMNFSFEPLQWDLNPEGIGVQPMLAKVDMGFKFIGGSSLGGPIKQLQNAVSYNFFANTGVYRPWYVVQESINAKQKFIYGAFLDPKDEEVAYGNITPVVNGPNAVPPVDLQAVTAGNNLTPAAQSTTATTQINTAAPSNTQQSTSGKPPTSNKPPVTPLVPKIIPDSYIYNNCDELHAFQSTGGKKIGEMHTKVTAELEKLWKQGINPIVTSVKIQIFGVANKNARGPEANQVNWEVKIEDNGKNGPAYLGFTSRGAGCGSNLTPQTLFDLNFRAKNNADSGVPGSYNDIRFNLNDPKNLTPPEPNVEIKFVQNIGPEDDASLSGKYTLNNGQELNNGYWFTQNFVQYTRPEFEKANPRSK